MRDQPLQRNDTDFVRRAEYLGAILISLVILFLLVVRATHAGGLWRDECASMRYAGCSSLAEVREMFPFPLLQAAIIRVHTILFGKSDGSLRCLGIIAGVALIGVAWLGAHSNRIGAPLTLLSLLGLNSVFLISGTAVRGYGLGSVIAVLTASLVARVLVNSSAAAVIVLLLAFLAAPQLLVHDAPLMLTIAIAAIAVCIFRGRWKLAMLLFATAALTALCCLPYLAANAPGNSNIVLKYPISFAGVWYNFTLACGPPESITPWAWIALIVLAVAAALWRLATTLRDPSSSESDLLLFGIFLGIASVLGYFVFLRILNYWPHPWYYLPLMAVMAVAIDLIIGSLPFRLMRWARLIFAVIIGTVLAIAGWPKLLERQTNIDIIATGLEKKADANDLIVVNPWDRGVSFNWYYRGPARWITVPMMSEHRRHRYDLLKAKMMSAHPLDDLFASIAEKLRSGQRVWLVGGAHLLNPGEFPHWLPPAPNSEFGWNNDAYRNSWSQQLGAFVQEHAERLEISESPATLVNDVEKEPVWLLEGWRD